MTDQHEQTARRDVLDVAVARLRDDDGETAAAIASLLRPDLHPDAAFNAVNCVWHAREVVTLLQGNPLATEAILDEADQRVTDSERVLLRAGSQFDTDVTQALALLDADTDRRHLRAVTAWACS